MYFLCSVAFTPALVLLFQGRHWSQWVQPWVYGNFMCAANTRDMNFYIYWGWPLGYVGIGGCHVSAENWWWTSADETQTVGLLWHAGTGAMPSLCQWVMLRKWLKLQSCCDDAGLLCTLQFHGCPLQQTLMLRFHSRHAFCPSQKRKNAS